jgi:Domain of unknown function (DUF1707)
MTSSPEMRASDSDRDRVAGMLREHYAEGRLTVDEFDERLEKLYASKTYGELQLITADLPGIDLGTYSARVEQRKEADKAAKARAKRRKDLRDGWAAWAVIGGVNWVIWLIVSLTSDGDVYPWPLWVMGPWGVIMLVATLAEAGKDSGDGKKFLER